MPIGRARVSTDEQTLGLQLDAPTAGRKRVFTDRVSTTKDDHPGLAHAIARLRQRGVLVNGFPPRRGEYPPGARSS
jgi:DNA invertase Pin-like site-specific DNA recombinase